MKMSLNYFLHYKYFGFWVVGFFFHFLLEGKQRSLRKERRSMHQGFYLCSAQRAQFISLWIFISLFYNYWL